MNELFISFCIKYSDNYLLSYHVLFINKQTRDGVYQLFSFAIVLLKYGMWWCQKNFSLNQVIFLHCRFSYVFLDFLLYGKTIYKSFKMSSLLIFQTVNKLLSRETYNFLVSHEMLKKKFDKRGNKQVMYLVTSLRYGYYITYIEDQQVSRQIRFETPIVIMFSIPYIFLLNEQLFSITL